MFSVLVSVKYTSTAIAATAFTAAIIWSICYSTESIKKKKTFFFPPPPFCDFHHTINFTKQNRKEREEKKNKNQKMKIKIKKIWSLFCNNNLSAFIFYFGGHKLRLYYHTNNQQLSEPERSAKMILAPIRPKLSFRFYK